MLQLRCLRVLCFLCFIPFKNKGKCDSGCTVLQKYCLCLVYVLFITITSMIEKVIYTDSQNVLTMYFPSNAAWQFDELHFSQKCWATSMHLLSWPIYPTDDFKCGSRARGAQHPLLLRSGICIHFILHFQFKKKCKTTQNFVSDYFAIY